MRKKGDDLLRQPRPSSTYNDLDLTKPLDMKEFNVTPVDCFGSLWDITSKQCAVCSDNEICGIVTGNAVRAKARELDKVKQYLDLSEIDCINEDGVKIWLSMKSRTVPEFVAKIHKEGKTQDEVAVVEWIKRFVKANDKIYIKDGIVCTRK